MLFRAKKIYEVRINIVHCLQLSRFWLIIFFYRADESKKKRFLSKASRFTLLVGHESVFHVATEISFENCLPSAAGNNELLPDCVTMCWQMS